LEFPRFRGHLTAERFAWSGRMSVDAHGVTPVVRSGLVRVLCAHDPGRARTITMKRTRHTPEQVIRKLRDADRLLAEQKTIAEIAKELGVSENTYHRWRNQYGGMKADDVKRLKELERENQRLKRIVANQALDIDGLKEIVRGNF
jgi:putative transposase